ncbi:chemotaxis response regulator protein-glutamate methylesterase [Vallitalea longa]|uniref:Protein-glutamate methylesterase/protein-glutamine glutaminase n=1 Tax=Vallitalea longa TaxID=2936439 RepID=A0A9W5Y9D6_9FIRM|nr:chemotaxis response regulator protein-glutamate methylesterase [Vallitalea longa]GKX28964.1 chemotaxis response regulator protein-glutamate methylesterase [Vallitalea longa]
MGINNKKILVIDDSAFMRRVISDIIKSDSRCEVIGTAKNGEDGLQKIKELKPDVVTLDIEMPIMNGLEMLEQLKLDKIHVPIIVMSTLASEGTQETIRALELGAIDFVTKPQNIFKVNTEEMKNKLIEKLLMAVNIKTPKIQQLKPRRRDYPSKKFRTTKPENDCLSINSKIVAIGCSTGGPRALQYVLPYLPSNLDAGIIIVQHMPAGFTKSLADRLNQLSEINVKEAEDGDIIEKGTAYIAPGNYHMKVIQDKKCNLCIKLSKEDPFRGHRPAVDVMMNSLVDVNIDNLIGVIMTGMGNDGTEGLWNLKDNHKIHIIAQDEETCVVYGMPKAVVAKGIADEIIPLESISDSILKKVGVL